MASAPLSFFQAVRGLLLLAAVAAHIVCIRFLAGGTLPVLIDIATRWCFVRSWERQLNRRGLVLIFSGVILICSGVLLGDAGHGGDCGASVGVFGGCVAENKVSGWLGGGCGRSCPLQAVSDTITAVFVWWPLLTLHLLSMGVVQFCSLGLDAFALELLNAPAGTGLCGLVGQYNVLSATIRRAAYSAQCALALLAALTLALCIATLVQVLPATLPNSTSEQNAQKGTRASSSDIAATAWTAALVLLGLWLLNSIADVNLKCRRLPGLLHSLDFGAEIDHDRWCVASLIAGSESGFPVHSVLVTRGAVLKLGYMSVSGLSLVAMQLATSIGSGR
eukprot:TRINITY_DN15245_c0_g9_i1.p1 TRINITY_DN15245_c0_g9~~TRINITY_DN15245_c0_g9_i1.p1  ORF type:complete len:375 (+),score=50.92 TRINITY_DN15245_c0_g9_i1:124-1125(+)